MTNHNEIVAVLLIFCQFIGVCTLLDLTAICQPASLPCVCGSSGISIHLSVKQCSHFYKWKHRCDFCDNFDKDSFCTKFQYCLECNSESETCSTCSPDRYGQFCTGICNCQNGGTCLQPNGACSCPPKFEGANCQTKKLASCPSPENVINGIYSITGITEGSTITYECNKGFVLNGQSVRTCTEDGIWSQSLPACLPFCVKPKLPPNLIETVVDLVNNVLSSVTSLLTGPSSTQIKSITYKCKDGFKLVGEETIHCKNNGRWSNPPPTCKKNCLPPQPPANGYVNGESFIEGDVIEFNCKSKFSLNGSRKSTCQKDGTWSSATPMCLQQTFCPILDSIKNGERVLHDENGVLTDNQIIFEGFKTIVHCNKDYILMGSSERICGKSGTWSGDPATCIKWPQNVDCKTKGRDVIGEVGEFVRIDCPSGCIGTSNVIGTAIYSENSLVCRAAIHIGKVTNRGGTFYLVNNGIFSPFVSSLLNGIQSVRSSKSTISFRFAEFEKEIKEVNKEISCPFGWELFENICLHFPSYTITWNEAKSYCEKLQGHLTILHQTDNHFALTNAMETKGISKVWIGLENKTNTLVWLDGTQLHDGEFDAWLQEEPTESKTCVYTTTSGWGTESCEQNLPFICQFEKQVDTAMFCPDPKSIDNGVSSIDGLSNLIFSDGAIVSYSCNQYYYLQGPRENYCSENGSWTHPFPKCLFVPSCPEPPILLNAKIKHIIPPESRTKRQIPSENVPDFHPVGVDETLDNITDIEAFLFENETSLIENNSESDNETFLFDNERLFLTNDSGIDNGTYLSRNETSSFKNNSGHVEETERISRSHFKNISTIEGTEGERIPYNLPIPPNHHRSGTKVVYECQSSFYELIGSKTATCQDNGEWTDNIPTCKQVCGISSFPRPPLVINGNISQVGQWPWQVSISMVQEKKWNIVCGGSLLNKNWIVTAAHCVTFPQTKTIFPFNNFLISLGKHYRDSSKDDKYVKQFQVVDIKVNKLYNPQNFHADIALIKLNQPVEFNHRIQPICLPPAGNLETTERLQEGQKGIVIGWGITEENILAEELRYVNVPIVSKKKCEKEYKDAGMPFIVTEYMYCAGFDEGLKDACSGDSGGPMVFQTGSEDKGTWTLEGIVSWGSPEGCAFPKQYGGYTRVERFIDWIDEYI